MQAARLILAAILSFGSHIALAQPNELPVPKPTEPPKLDAYGDPLPPGALARFGTVRWRHDAKAVAFLDNKTIVSVGSSIRFWDAMTGRLIREHRHEKMTQTMCATICADGKHAVSRNADGYYRVWDLGIGQMIGEFKGAFDTIRGRDDLEMPFSVDSDGTRFAVSEWNLNSGSVLGRVTIYSSNAKTVPIVLPGHMSISTVISSDGSRVANAVSPGPANADPALEILDAANGEQICSHTIEVGGSVQLAFMPDGKALATVGKKNFGLRSTDGKVIWSLPSDAESLSIVCLTSNRLVLLATKKEARSCEIRVVDAASGMLLQHWPAPRRVEAAAVSPDGERLVIASAGRLRVVDLSNGREIVAAPGHSYGVRTTVVSPDGRFVASADKSDVLLWDTETGQIVKRLEGHSEGCQAIAMSTDGKLLAHSFSDVCVSILQVATGRRIFKPAEFDEPVWAMHFLADNERLAMCTWAGDLNDGGRIVVCHCPSGKVVHELSMSGPAVPTGLVRSSDGRLLGIYARFGFDGTRANKVIVASMDVWDIPSGRIVRHVGGYSAGWVRTTISCDFRTLAARGDDDAIHLWELSTGQPRLTINEPQKLSDQANWGRPFAFSPDGLMIAAVSNRNSGVDLWDLPSGKRIGSLPGDNSPISTLDFTPNGRRLLTGSDDSTILAWDTTRPELRSRPLRRNLTDDDLARHWDRLRNANAEEAYRSKWALAGDPKKTVAFLQRRLPSTPPIPIERIKSWIVDLDSNEYSARDQAQSELMNHFDQSEGFLRQALAGTISGEARNRINRIIDASFAAIPEPDQLRDLRAVEVLEQIGTPEARDLLRRLGSGEVPTRVSRDAAESLKRLESRPR